MKAKEIRDLTAEEQAQRLTEAEAELASLRHQKAMGQLEKPVLLRAARREVARIRTILNESRKEA
ncbi:MAG: 50S ribosomal protein L29 [Kiritimatiellae bacterium]|nr:50S ribosomal protein L29 [Kiritimatiellia bacterium]MBQ9344375.1 50S ribosomal protein L29 [Kiritimatiellia bacterium]